MLSLLVSSHRSHYKESPGDRMVPSTKHPRGAPIRNIPFVQREGEAQAPRVIPSHPMCCSGNGWGGRGAGMWCPLWGDRGMQAWGLPHTQAKRLCNVTLSPEGHQAPGQSPCLCHLPALAMPAWSNGDAGRVMCGQHQGSQGPAGSQVTFPRMLSDVGTALAVIAS